MWVFCAGPGESVMREANQYTSAVELLKLCFKRLHRREIDSRCFADVTEVVGARAPFTFSSVVGQGSHTHFLRLEYAVVS